MTVSLVDDHDLIMGDFVLGVDEHRNAVVGHEIGPRVLVGEIALVEDDLNRNTALVGIHQGFENILVGEAIGLDEDRLPGGIEGPHDGFGGAALGREVDVDGRQRARFGVAPARQGRQDQQCRHDTLHYVPIFLSRIFFSTHANYIATTGFPCQPGYRPGRAKVCRISTRAGRLSLSSRSVARPTAVSALILPFSIWK